MENKKFMNDNNKKKFYETMWFMWIMLLAFAPVGIFLMWKYNRFSNNIKKVVTAVFAVWFLASYANALTSKPNTDNNATLATTASTPKVDQAKKDADTKARLDKLAAEQKIKDDANKKAKDDTAAKEKAEADKMSTDILYYSQVKAKEIFKDRVVKIEKDTQGILITFKLTDNLSLKMVGNGGFIDVNKMFALYKGHLGDYTDVTCLGTYPMKDKYGTITDDTIFAITLDKDTIQKTTFENLDPTKDLIPLSSSHAIRAELTK